MAHPNGGLDADLRAAYLGRLGLEEEPPSADALRRLHRAHAETVPYETMWIRLGEAWDVDPFASAERVATRGRGGYCFHLNGAFSELLASLGYQVTRHLGGVHGPDGPSLSALGNHLVLTVSELASEDNPGGDWYVDVGLGDALHDAVPLLPSAFRQGPFQMSLEETPDGVGDWHFTHDPSGSFPGMSWRADTVSMEAFVDHHRSLSTSPESGFVRVATAQRRDTAGVDILRDLTLTRVGEGAAPTQLLTERAEWFAVLADMFGLPFDGIEPRALDLLWEKTVASHQAQLPSG